MKFFLDCADANYLQEKFDLIRSYDPNINFSFLGVTTNPRIMQKAGVTNIKEYSETLIKICEFLHKNSKYCKDTPTLWVQPFSLNGVVQYQFIEQVTTIISRFDVKAGIKVAPFNKWLNAAKYIYEYTGQGVNVTGLTTAVQALFCLANPYVDYVSMIPGRMLEKNIMPVPQVRYVAQQYASSIIVGSLRTFFQISDMVDYGVIPTIGNSVLDQINSIGDCKLLFDSFLNSRSINEDYPHVDDIDNHIKLSKEFFASMDEIAAPLYKEFNETL